MSGDWAAPTLFSMTHVFTYHFRHFLEFTRTIGAVGIHSVMCRGGRGESLTLTGVFSGVNEICQVATSRVIFDLFE